MKSPESSIFPGKRQDTEPEVEQRMVILMVALNAFATPMMLSASNVALPAIGERFALTAVGLAWVPMAFLMASAMFILSFGRIADIYGRKRLFLLGTTAVIATSLFTAFSINAEMLLIGRFLQGVSAAMLNATQIAIVTSVFPPDRRGRVIGLVVAAVYVGLAAGPLLGGIVTDLFGWRANFFLHIPIAIVVLGIGIARVQGEWSGEKQPLDAVGALLFAATIAFLCIGISRFPDPSSVLLLVATALGLAAFVRHALTHSSPIWNIQLLVNNVIFSRSCGASMIMYTATYANVVLMSLYLQQIQGLTASRAGLILMVQPFLMAILSPAMGRMSDRFEPRLLASLGMALTAVGLLILSQLTLDSSLQMVIIALAITGVGFSLFSSPNTNAIMSSVERKDYGSASGAVATTRVLGQLNSMVLVALIMALIIGDQLIDSDNLESLAQAIRLCFGIAAVICVPGVLLSMSRGRMHGQT